MAKRPRASVKGDFSTLIQDWGTLPGWALVCILSSELVGRLIESAGHLRKLYPQSIFLLPLAALLLFVVDSHERLRLPALGELLPADGRQSHQSRARKLGPLLLFLFAVFLSHSVGASVGREGVVMLLALFVFLAFRHRRQSEPDEIAALIGCAFAAATSNVIAGAFLAIETGELKRSSMVRTFILYACFTMFWMGLGRGFPFFQSTVRPLSNLGWTDFSRYLIAALIGVGAGGLSFAFHWVVKRIRNLVHTTAAPRIWIFLIGCFLMTLLASPWGASSQGLGVEGIRRFFQSQALVYEPAIKMLATALSIGIGLKGGEYTPLLWIGSGFGSLFSGAQGTRLVEWMPIAFSPAQLAALGFGGVFAHASRCPLASIALVVGLGGWGTLPFAIVVCLISHSIGGTDSLYLIPSTDRWRIKRYFL